MADHKITITATPSKVKQINVTSNTVTNQITATPDTSLYFSNLSKNWATKMDGLVVNDDYSSKYYAEQSKQSAEVAKMEASTTTELKNLLKEDFDDYTESLNNTKNLAIEEINTTSTVAIGNLNTLVTSSTGQINAVAKEQTELVASTANKALEDIETLTTNSTQALESLTEASSEDISALGNTIKADAKDWIDVINATGKSYNMVTHRQITNCITEIPQDIKLELKDGVLTLKAGSKVYVPNGFEADGTTPKFDEVVVAVDKTRTDGTANKKCFVILNNALDILMRVVDDAVSGPTATTSSNTTWYDTTNNDVKAYYTGTVANNCSLPLAIVSCDSSGGITSINQVFNGFGYIGSTVFILPNVKGLIPNGRNEDGTLKNIEAISTKLSNITFTEDIKNIYFGFSTKSNMEINGAYSYDEFKNLVYNHSNITKYVPCGKYDITNGKITNFQLYKPFRAIDYSDKSVVSGWSFPSRKYIDLTVGASGTSYTAPANGLFCAYCVMTNTNAYLDMNVGGIYNVRIKDASWNSSDIAQIIPVKNGSVLSLNYSGVNFYSFRFIYAEGEV